jgi:hypothetical protein
MQYLIWRPPTLTQMADAQGVMTLGQASAGPIANQVAVIIIRHWKSKCSKQENLARGGFQKVGSAYDFADLHVCIVDNDRKLIGRDVVPAPNHKVSEISATDEAL